MMLMQDELGLIARDILDDLERARPGFPLDAAGFKEAALARMRVRLTDLLAQYASVGSDADYERVARELEEVLLARYVIFAREHGERERHGGGAWRGGDVVSRIVFALIGLAVGGFLVWAPFIPIWEKWVPFLLMLLAPVIPDLQRYWFHRQHRQHLAELERDMKEAARALRDSQPLNGLLQESATLSPSSSAKAAIAAKSHATPEGGSRGSGH